MVGNFFRNNKGVTYTVTDVNVNVNDETVLLEAVAEGKRTKHSISLKSAISIGFIDFKTLERLIK